MAKPWPVVASALNDQLGLVDSASCLAEFAFGLSLRCTISFKAMNLLGFLRQHDVQA